LRKHPSQNILMDLMKGVLRWYILNLSCCVQIQDVPRHYRAITEENNAASYIARPPTERKNTSSLAYI
jgi:hypothetical protein